MISDRAQGEYFFLELAERTRGPLAVAFGGREWCGPDYQVERETYPFVTLEFVAEGEGELRWEGGEVQPLRAGTLFAYGPGVPLRMAAVGKGMLKYFVALTGQGARRALSEPVDLWRQTRQLEVHAELRSICDLLVEEGREHAPMAAELCLNVFRRLQLKLEQAQRRREAAPDYARQRFLACKAQVEADPGRFASVEDMAKVAGLSRPLLFRLFRRFQGVTPYRYLLRQKMNRAAHELISTDLLAKEVAARAGFADPLHFSRVFRQVHKTSPSQFRRSQRR